jgi:chromosome segregation ATPase
MSDVIDWIDKLQGLGVGALALLFLYITNKWWANKLQETEDKHEGEKKQIRKDFTTVIEGKDTVIADLSGQLRTAAEQSRADMERHLTRYTDEIQRVEQTIAANTAAVSGLQDLVRSTRGGGS